MVVDPDFSFRPLPPIDRPLRFLRTGSEQLGLLEDLHGTWTGRGFNVIWRPNRTPGQGRFLELNLTEEILRFERIRGAIPNRGFLQSDINMFGLTYLQQIKDLNNHAGLHIEPGIWAAVPQTENPAEAPTIVRMASVPHGTVVLAQGLATSIAGPPVIPKASITPFAIGKLDRLTPFPESNLAAPSDFRSSAADITGITQAMVDDPNSVLVAALAGQTMKSTVKLDVSSDPTKPVPGGGIANTAFLQGSSSAGPNARTASVSATFWIETLQDSAGGPDIYQLQYTQTVLLNFNNLSWPHVTVATLRRK